MKNKPTAKTDLVLAPPIQAYSLAMYLANQIRLHYPRLASLRPAELNKTLPRWADDINKIVRIDGAKEGVDERAYTWQSVAFVLKWAIRHDFWRANIMSGAKFRRQYDKLVIHIIDEKNKQKNRRKVKAI